MLKDKVINIGICACSPAVNMLDIIRRLRKAGAIVNVTLTPNAKHFIPEILVQREAGTQIQIEQFEMPKIYDANHKSFSGNADLFLIAPASANTIGKAANGIADNLLTTNLLSTRCPVMVALHCNPAIYEKASVQRNIRFLKEDGYIFIETDAKSPSLFPSNDKIMQAIEAYFAD